MQNHLRKILLLIFSCVFLNSGVLSQQIKQNPNKNISTIGLKRLYFKKSSTKSDFARDIPQVEPQPANLTDQDILNFFVREKKYVKYFDFISALKKDTISIRYDSLLPKHTQFVDEFIRRNNNLADVDGEYFATPPFRNIYDKISTLQKINYEIRSKSQLNSLFLLISGLSDCKEKVFLFLKCAHLGINNDTYYEDIYSYCDRAKKYTQGISDLYERSKAFTAIGDFAALYKINGFAIQMFYLAREAIENCTKSSKIKYNEQASICEKLSWVFYSQNSEEALEKRGVYLQNARDNFYSARNYRNADIDAALVADIASELWVNFWQYNADDSSKLTHTLVLNYLYNWYKTRRGIDDELDYIGLNAIALNIYSYNEKVALKYYLEALSYISCGSNLQRLVACIDNISISFAAIGEKDLAISYSNLALHITYKLNYNFENDLSYLNKARTFFDTKRYDSALSYVNEIILDTSLKKKYYPPSYNQILEQAYLIKYQTWDLLKNNDSARIYERFYTGYQIEHLQNLIDLIEIESKSINDWFERSKGKEISIKEKLIATEKRDIEFLHNENRLLDSISVLNAKNATKALEGKRYSDSLVIIKEVLRTADSINHVKDNKLITEKAARERTNIFIRAAFTLLLITVLYFINLVRIQTKRRTAENKIKDEELKRVKAEMRLLSNLAIDHDIDKFIPGLPLYFSTMTPATKENLQRVLEKFKDYFLTTKQLGNSLLNTIKTEIEIAKKSSEVYLYMVGSTTIPQIITDFDSDPEIENLEIPKNMLTSFIANSIKHGSIGKREISVLISVQRKQNGYWFTIDDDGIGFEFLNIKNKPSDEGINLVLSQVQNFNETNKNYQIQFTPENIINKPKKTGVIVTFKLIKV